MSRFCAFCGVEFKIGKPRRGAPSKYCDDCRQPVYNRSTNKLVERASVSLHRPGTNRRRAMRAR